MGYDGFTNDKLLHVITLDLFYRRIRFGSLSLALVAQHTSQEIPARWSANKGA
jgi:hypothetical protein